MLTNLISHVTIKQTHDNINMYDVVADLFVNLVIIMHYQYLINKNISTINNHPPRISTDKLLAIY